MLIVQADISLTVFYEEAQLLKLTIELCILHVVSSVHVQRNLVLSIQLLVPGIFYRCSHHAMLVFLEQLNIELLYSLMFSAYSLTAHTQSFGCHFILFRQNVQFLVVNALLPFETVFY